MANDTAKMEGEQGDAEIARMIERFADNVRSNNSFINAAKGVPPTPIFADPDFEMYPAFGHENEALGRPLKAQSNTANGIAELLARGLGCMPQEKADLALYAHARQGGKTAATINELGRQLLAADITIADLRAWIVQCERTIAGFRATEADKDAEIATLRAELDQAKQSQAPAQPNPKTDQICQPGDNPFARRFRGGLGQAFEDRS